MNSNFEKYTHRIKIALRKMESLGDARIKIYTGEIRRIVAQMIKSFGEEISIFKKDLLLLDKNMKDIFASVDLDEVLLRNKLDQVMQLMEQQSLI